MTAAVSFGQTVGGYVVAFTVDVRGTSILAFAAGAGAAMIGGMLCMPKSGVPEMP